MPMLFGNALGGFSCSGRLGHTGIIGKAFAKTLVRDKLKPEKFQIIVKNNATGRCHVCMIMFIHISYRRGACGCSFNDDGQSQGLSL